MPRLLPAHPKRILVAPLRFIGDGVLTVPLLRALHLTYPEAQIDLLLPKSMMNLFELCPYVHRVLTWPKSRMELFRQVQSQDYDIGIVMRRSWSDAFIFRQAGVRYLVGYDEQRFPMPLGYKRFGLFLDKAVPFPPLNTDVPQVKTYLELLYSICPKAAPATESLELWADELDEVSVEQLLDHYRIDPADPIAVIHGTSASREKALAFDKFIPGLRALEHHGYALVAFGTQSDRAFYDELARLAGVSLVNVCGETTLRQSFVLLRRTKILFSLDSAPIHMAVAADVPSIVGIYGPTNEKQWRPYPYSGNFTPVFNRDLSCRPCVPKLCSHNRCRVDLNPLDISQAIENHL